jgi:hypothetical protein
MIIQTVNKMYKILIKKFKCIYFYWMSLFIMIKFFLQSFFLPCDFSEVRTRYATGKILLVRFVLLLERTDSSNKTAP